MKAIEEDAVLFDFKVGHFVKKEDLSEEAQKAYLEHFEAHIEHLKKRTLDLRKQGLI